MVGMEAYYSEVWYRYYQGTASHIEGGVPTSKGLVSTGSTPGGGTRSTGYRLRIEKLQHLQLPNSTMIPFDKYHLVLRCHISLFDCVTRRFFGNTWTSEYVKIPTNQRSTETIDLECNFTTYYHSTCSDPNCIAVAETAFGVVVNNEIVQEFGVGWCALRTFSASFINKRDTKRRPHTTTFYCGSPRALFMVDGAPDSWTLPVAGNMQMCYSVDVHTALKHCSHLIRENELVGVHDNIPGLDHTYNSEKQREIDPSCKSSRYIFTNLEEPQLEQEFSIQVQQLRLSITNRYENELITALESNRRAEFNLSGADQMTSTILERRLVVGVHNGKRFVTPPHVETFQEENGYFVHEEPIILHRYVNNPCYCILFQLECTARIPLPQTGQKSAGFVERTIPLAYYPFLPNNAEMQLIQGEFSVELFSGPARDVNNRNSFIYSDISREGVVVDFQLEIDAAIEARTVHKQKLKDTSKFAVVNLDRMPEHMEQEARSIVEDKAELMKLHNTKLPYPSVTATAPTPTRAASRQSRMDRLALYDVGFPQVLDRHGQKPFEVPVNIHTDIDLTLESADQLQSNEIVIQFLSVSDIPMSIEGKGFKPSNLFFSFQFYRYPLLVSERISLDASQSEQRIRVINRLDDKGQPVEQKGLTLRFTGEGPNFVQYLKSSTLQVDIWDGDSLLLIGTAGFELKHLLRQQREAVQITDDLDIQQSERDHISEDSLLPAQLRILGRLQLRISNIGKPTDPAFVEYKNNAVVHEKKHQKTNEQLRVWAKQYHSKDSELAFALENQKLGVSDTSPEMFSQQAEQLDIKKRKYIRLKLMQQSQNRLPKTAFEGRKERDKALKLTQLYRERAKREGISTKLREYLTTVHRIYPSFGCPVFFEFVFHNPFSEEHCFSIHIDDPDVSIITNSNEWRLFKRTLSLTTPTEEDIIQGNKMLLKPNEHVHVPFKFLSFYCGAINKFPFNVKHSSSNLMLENIIPDEPIKPRSVHILFNNQHNRTMSVVELQVYPQPFVVDKTFHFYNAENDFLKKSIRMRNQFNVFNASTANKYIHCSSNNVIANSVVSPDPTELQAVTLKYRCGPGPQVTRFYIQLYNDPFKISLLETWQIFVHSLQRLDLVGITGQTTKSPLILRGGINSRLIQCYSSNNNELNTYPSSPINLIAGALTEVTLLFRPLTPGKRQMFINIVDVEFHQLIGAWLISTTSNPPTITQEFELEHTANKTSTKSIDYTNPYTYKKVITLHTDQPQLLAFADQKLELDAGASVLLKLIFKPAQHIGRVTLHVFINDDDCDKTEECIAIHVNYK